MTLKIWVEILQGLFTTIALLIGGFWAWTRFVVERGLLPPSAMRLELQTIGSSESARIVEITIQIQNEGASTLVVADLVIRIRYLNENDRIDVFADAAQPWLLGRVNFLHAHVLNEVGADKRVVKQAKRELKLNSGEFLLVPYDTIVLPGIQQSYSFVTALPPKATFVLVRGSFKYEIRPSWLQSFFLGIARKLGMLQYSLSHLQEPHTAEKSFKIG